MRITGIELTPVRTSREMGRSKPGDPQPAISEHVVVRLHTDADIIGLGEMSDINWTPDAGSLDALRTRLEDVLVGGDAMRRGPLMEALAVQAWEHQVLCGLDIALHDAVGRHLGVSLSELLGGRFRDRMPFAYPLAPCGDDDDVQANLRRVGTRMEQGHRAFRYYFGLDIGQDETFLETARGRWGDSLHLVALDASGRFDPATAIAVLRRLAPYGPDLFESPVQGRHNAPADDFLRVKAEIDVPLSEHIADEAVATRLASSGAVDVFNTGLGYAGIEPCRRTFGLARQFGLRALMGSTVEMSIGTAARVQVAAATPNLDLPCYMAGPLVHDQDITREPVAYAEGHIVVPTGPGVGVELDPERLAALRI